MMNTTAAVCPYCSVVLEPAPSRTKKCPDCGEKVVRRRDRFTDEISYLTVDNNYRADCYLRLSNMGLSDAEDRFSATEARLEREWGKKPTPQDAFWRVLNDAVSESLEQATVNQDRRTVEGMLAATKTLSMANSAYTFMELELRAQGRDTTDVVRSREQVHRLSEQLFQGR